MSLNMNQYRIYSIRTSLFSDPVAAPFPEPIPVSVPVSVHVPVSLIDYASVSILAIVPVPTTVLVLFLKL